jgi:hypothetical protein
MTKSWIEKLPVVPLSELIRNQMEEFDSLSKISGQPLHLDLCDTGTQKMIHRSKKEIMHAKSRDEMEMATARLNLSQEEQKRLRGRVAKTVTEMLLGGRYVCVGYLDGEKHVIPARAWSGRMGWDQEILTFEDQQYLHVRAIEGWRLTPEQREMVHNVQRDDVDPPDCGKKSTGRPTWMHLIEPEFDRRRMNGSAEKTLAAESVYLAAWFKKQHPRQKPPKEKTITNRMREHLNEQNRNSE